METTRNELADVYDVCLKYAPTGGTERERQAWLNGLQEALGEIGERAGVYPPRDHGRESEYVGNPLGISEVATNA
jgi:hypothetical protein